MIAVSVPSHRIGFTGILSSVSVNVLDAVGDSISICIRTLRIGFPWITPAITIRVLNAVWDAIEIRIHLARVTLTNIQKTVAVGVLNAMVEAVTIGIWVSGIESKTTLCSIVQSIAIRIGIGPVSLTRRDCTITISIFEMIEEPITIKIAIASSVIVRVERISTMGDLRTIVFTASVSVS